MKLEKIPKECFKTTKWSGGTTTEFFIYPKGADYAERNFEVRISSATVDDESSIFTSLPGVFRSLMILEGIMELDINGTKTKLSPYEHIEFSGDDKTISFGKAKDFNLMTRSSESYIDIIENSAVIDTDGICAFYSIEDPFTVTAENESTEAQKGELVVVYGKGNIKIDETMRKSL